jgi:hypothetical protein
MKAMQQMLHQQYEFYYLLQVLLNQYRFLVYRLLHRKLEKYKLIFNFLYLSNLKVRAVMVQGLTLPTFTSMIMGSIPGLVKDIF